MYVDEKKSGELFTPSLPGFISWLERQDPAQAYDWICCDNCACAQYAESIGRNFKIYGRHKGEWDQLNHLAMPLHFKDTFDTFGNLLARARAARD